MIGNRIQRFDLRSYFFVSDKSQVFEIMHSRNTEEMRKKRCKIFYKDKIIEIVDYTFSSRFKQCKVVK